MVAYSAKRGKVVASLRSRLLSSPGIAASMLSKWELGPRRTDLREPDLYLRPCEVDLVEFVAAWQQAVQGSKVVAVEVQLKKGRPVGTQPGP